MNIPSRRTVLTAFAGDLGGRGATAAAAGVPTPACAGTDAFCTNTGLYRNTLYTEGDHWARRYRRSGGAAQPGVLSTFPVTAAIAPHGGWVVSFGPPVTRAGRPG
ncbi:hypothetical protein ACGFX4_10285 [Kitasatospora sp. NPDC048365]|uniref:hypothetical protein n=1 Tax=Kitasatospora sp. NPDC048365 TaxID=3364050 RepID=UPI0037148011